MARVHHPSLNLEPMHCRAIGEEIGERLRYHLDRDRSPIPLHLRRLLDRFVQMDGRARMGTAN
jgi:hypothetical protein